MESSAVETLPSAKCSPLPELSCSQNSSNHPEDAPVCKIPWAASQLKQNVAQSATINIPRENSSTPTPGSMDPLCLVSISLEAPFSAPVVEQTKLETSKHAAVRVYSNGQLKFPQSYISALKHIRRYTQRLLHSFSSVKKFAKLLKHKRLRDDSYDSFKTISGKVEPQFSNQARKLQEPGEKNWQQETEPVPAIDGYLDDLEGPELDALRESVELVLPEDKTWPFLLRFPISSFGMCLGVGSQAMLWKTLAASSSLEFFNVSQNVNLFLWCAAVTLTILIASIYALKILFYFEAVRREFYHPVRVNFFFAPWIACLFLAIGLPPHIATNIPQVLWFVLMAPILCLEIKIYGQWMSGGERRLSKVANPSNHLAVVGNFVGALLGAKMGLMEGPVFFFAVGVAHYTVLFVTLCQRLPTNETLPKDLHPVFFLFIAAPSVACTSWAEISGTFGLASRIPYFISMFLYASLAVRLNFFRGFRFSLAWWAYTFPMAGAAIATIRYMVEVENLLTKALATFLSIISTFTVSALLICTILNAFVFEVKRAADVCWVCYGAIWMLFSASEKELSSEDLHGKLVSSFDAIADSLEGSHHFIRRHLCVNRESGVTECLRKYIADDGLNLPEFSKTVMNNFPDEPAFKKLRGKLNSMAKFENLRLMEVSLSRKTQPNENRRMGDTDRSFIHGQTDCSGKHLPQISNNTTFSNINNIQGQLDEQVISTHQAESYHEAMRKQQRRLHSWPSREVDKFEDGVETCVPLESTSALFFSAFTSLLVEFVARLEHWVDAVEVLQTAKFKEEYKA
ncbi:hypothetical protein HPP92_005249 [Vanilla planifolia]|uniref:Uncharacterized protein n=1 Tax=Vanilla planifolia TaxID=51239 RepID=A0A835RN56_VANPL|nr:hypothetical protein HPP92_005249 [Vanilla planifolia]